MSDEIDFLFGQTDWPVMTRVLRKRSYVVAYDGSGSIGKDCAYAYGGAVSSQLQWNAFAEMWRAILDKHGLAYFKMSEAMGIYGEFLPKFTEWGTDFKAKRDALVAELASLKQRYSLSSTGSGFGNGGGVPLKAIGKTAVAKAGIFKDAVQELLMALPVDATVHFLCDIELDAEENYRSWIQSLASQDVATAIKVTGIGFFDDKYQAPLQYADMVAWIARQELERLCWGRPESEKNPLCDVLIGGPNSRFEIIR